MIVNPQNLKIRHLKAFHAVSLFSNCGAGDIGYKKAGFAFDVMAELQPARMDVCLLNHPDAVGVLGDLRETWQEVVRAYKQKARKADLSLLAACPPCQGMSSARGARGLHEDADAGSKDERNLLAVIIAEVARELNPKLIVVENVPEFFTKKVRHPNTNEPITASNLLIELLGERYHAFPIILDMADFDIPQSRRRSFMTFVRTDLPGLRRLLKKQLAPYPKACNTQISLNDFLESLQSPLLDARSPETATCANDNFPYHFVPVMDEKVYRMISAIPQNSGLSAWNNNLCNNCNNRGTDSDLYCSVCGEILPKPSVRDKKTGVVRLIKGFKTSYKRMSLGKPTPTVLTASGSISSHNTIHPRENRVFSLYECMKAQTFGDDFMWGETFKKHGISHMREMVGEAVPPKFTEKHGQILIEILNRKITDSLPIDDTRCRVAIAKLKGRINVSASSLPAGDHFVAGTVVEVVGKQFFNV